MKHHFLVEIGCEELPPKALKGLSEAFTNAVCEGLEQQLLSFEQVSSYATPRRLAISITGLAGKQNDREEEQLGPNVQAAFDNAGNPTKAALGFAQKCGVDVAQLDRIDTPKGIRLGLRNRVAGKVTTELLPAIIESALQKLPIPKRMRWGSSRAEFVRPVHWIVMLLDERVVPATIMGINSDRFSRGHRIHSPQPIMIAHADDYVENLRNGFVIAPFEMRRQHIAQAVQEIAQQSGGQAVIDPALLDEVTALNEWPSALMGKFDDAFLAVPAEALISSMKEHQKYFHVVDSNNNLLPCFITITNLNSRDPQQIVAGNEKVIRPRLADAAFFYRTDLKTSLVTRRNALKTIVFQTDLGSVYDKTERVSAIAGFIADSQQWKPEDAIRAAQLCKSDLVSEMVLEFGDLQGIMGRYYALHDGENEAVAHALYEQYLPRFSGDQVPASQSGIAVALADRIDTLTGIFGIGQAPSGSKDPFALRRASLGVVRTLIENQLSLSLNALLGFATSQHQCIKNKASTNEQVLTYIVDRLASMYADQGISTLVFQSVRAQQLDDPYDIHCRVLAVAAFSQLVESSSLADANKRVSNLLAKSDIDILPQVNTVLFQEAAEKALYAAISAIEDSVTAALANCNYQQALTQLASLQMPVNQFFDDVLVNCEDLSVRHNRLALLARLRELFLKVADISYLVPAKS